MDCLFDTVYNNLPNNVILTNLDSFLNFITTDYTGHIGNKYKDFNIAIDALLKKKEFALEHYDKFIKTNNCHFPSKILLINIINIINDNIESNVHHKFCVHLWLHIYH
jgi:hypothetical protein